MIGTRLFPASERAHRCPRGLQALQHDFREIAAMGLPMPRRSFSRRLTSRKEKWAISLTANAILNDVGAATRARLHITNTSASDQWLDITFV
jgi:hypothetical protein